MRSFELISFVLVISIFILQFIKRDKLNIILSFLLSATLITLITHFFIEGYRWQMLGTYIVFLVLLLQHLLKFPSRDKHKSFKGKKLYLVFLSVLLVLSFLFTNLFPIYIMMEPTGPYKIGTVKFETIDHNRVELYDPTTVSDRRLQYQVWYPSDSVENLEKAPWLLEGVQVSKGISKMTSFPSFTLNQTKYIMTHSYFDAALSTKKEMYPVIVISHGWTGFKALHTDLAEHFASNGYIVISIDHTFGAAVTVFDDGTINYYYEKALNDTVDEKTYTDSSNLLVTTYSKDISFIIDELTNLNEINATFYHSLDLDTIGLLGHSTGGGAGVLTAINDNRVKSIAGLDAWVEPINDIDINKGLKIPSFFFRSEQWEESNNNEYLYTLINQSTSNFGLYQINNTNHIDFSMSYVFSPYAKYVNMTGSIDRDVSINLQNDILLAFFNNTLVNNENDMHELTKYSDYIELVLEGN